MIIPSSGGGGGWYYSAADPNDGNCRCTPVVILYDDGSMMLNKVGPSSLLKLPDHVSIACSTMPLSLVGASLLLLNLACNSVRRTGAMIVFGSQAVTIRLLLLLQIQFQYR